VVEAHGQTRSGENLTSWKGSEINRARILAKAERVGLGDYDFVNWGDDTVVFTNEESASVRWMGKPDMFGFKEEMAAAPSFLMRYLPGEFNFLGRLLLSTINRETRSESKNDYAAAAAIATRAELLNAHPLGDTYLRVMRTAPAIPRLRRAVALACSGASAVELTMIASQIAGSNQTGAQWDDTIEQLGSLASAGNRDAVSATLYLSQIAALEQRRVAWGQFKKIADVIDIDVARRTIRDRSYVVGQQRRSA
jgi:hypothetical protein